MGKFYIFTAAIKEGFLGLAIIGVINSVISVYYYLRITIVMYMKGSDDPTAGEKVPAIVFSPAVIIAIIIAAYGVLRMGILPTDYIEIAHQSLIAFK
jgi:NADH-quinone oxidoreductase subunit N